MDADGGERRIADVVAEGRAVKVRLNMRDVAAEMAHDAERMRHERLHMKVREAARVAACSGRVGTFAALEAHLRNAEDRLADLAVVNVLAGAFAWLGEEVVDVACEVNAFFGRFGDHEPPFFDFVGERFFDEDMLARFKRFHGRFKVPSAVFGSACAYVNDVQVWFAVEHVLDGVVCLDAVSFGGVVGAFFDDVAYGLEVCQFVVGVRVGVGASDAAHSDNAYIQCHSNPFALFLLGISYRLQGGASSNAKRANGDGAGGVCIKRLRQPDRHSRASGNPESCRQRPRSHADISQLKP